MKWFSLLLLLSLSGCATSIRDHAAGEPTGRLPSGRWEGMLFLPEKTDGVTTIKDGGGTTLTVAWSYDEDGRTGSLNLDINEGSFFLRTGTYRFAINQAEQHVIVTDNTEVTFSEMIDSYHCVLVGTKQDAGYYLFYLDSLTGLGRGCECACQTYRKAKSGDVGAQFTLAQYYVVGETVEKDPVEAYKWFLLAGRQGAGYEDVAKKKLAALEPLMTAEQILRAKQWAEKWKPMTDED